MAAVPYAAVVGATGRAARLLGTAVLVLAVLPGAAARVPPARPAGTVVVVQLNLCNSGLALSCYSAGGAVAAAAARIRALRPDLVAVQEVCRGDLLAPAGAGPLAAALGGDRVAVAFAPAVDRDTGGPYRCTSGEPFGVALVARGGAVDVRSGRYRSQDRSDEARVWTCATVLDRRLTGCTTHLSTDRAVARRQCAELLAVLRSPWVRPAVVVAADLNLPAGGCDPPGYRQRGDGDVQHILFTGLTWTAGGAEGLPGTDHPLLHATLRPQLGKRGR